MSWHLVGDVFRNSLLITGLVLIMMLMIEYFNIHSHGKWFSRIKGSKIKQILLGSLLGMIPGCLGGFATVSLYTHKLLSLGALVAMMISSSGDEAFVIMAMIPKEGLVLFALLFAISIIVGIVVDYAIFKTPQDDMCPDEFEIHTEETEESERRIPSIFKLNSYKAMLHPSKERIAILIGIALFIGAVILGILQCGHHHSAHAITGSETEPPTLNILSEKNINIIFALVSIITLFFTATANEHFIKEHLWRHVIKRHLLPIFGWTFGTLLLCQIGMQYLDIEHWINNNMLTVVILAVLIGIIPESGPHLVFVTLFAQGVIPFYVLLVNSIVQDGHSALPLLAESKKSFAKAKLINIAVGLIIGIGCLILL